MTKFAQQCKAESCALLENDAANVVGTALRELLASQVRSSALATIFKISALPAFSPDVLRLREIPARYSLPSAIFAQASGPLYFALEPTTMDDEMVAMLTHISSEVVSNAAAHHGQACIVFCPPELKRATNVWGPAAAPDAAMMRRVKSAFDPQNIFAPGRFVSGI